MARKILTIKKMLTAQVTGVMKAVWRLRSGHVNPYDIKIDGSHINFTIHLQVNPK
jgi:hypothetical protein